MANGCCDHHAALIFSINNTSSILPRCRECEPADTTDGTGSDFNATSHSRKRAGGRGGRGSSIRVIRVMRESDHEFDSSRVSVGEKITVGLTRFIR